MHALDCRNGGLVIQQHMQDALGDLASTEFKDIQYNQGTDQSIAAGHVNNVRGILGVGEAFIHAMDSCTQSYTNHAVLKKII